MTKILLVEDDVNVSATLKRLLQKEDIEVDTAENGNLGMLKAQQGGYELIIIDQFMPELDGLSMLHALRQTEWGKLLPVLILTGYETSELAAVTKGLNASYRIKSGKSATITAQTIMDFIKQLRILLAKAQ